MIEAGPIRRFLSKMSQLPGLALQRVRKSVSLCSLFLLISMCHAAPAAAYELIKGPSPRLETDLRWSAYRRFSSTEGLPGNTVYALVQDKEGFVYAGTENGFARFDGHAWHKIELPTSSHNSMILRLDLTDNGDIWIGTTSAGLFRYSHGIINAIPLPNDAQESDIEALAVADSKSVYAGTSRSLYRCDASHCEEMIAGRGLQISVLLIGELDGQRYLWIGTNEDGLYRVDGIAAGQPRRAAWHLGEKELGAKPVRSLAQWGGNDGRDLWVGTGRGLVRVSHDTITAYSATPDDAQNGVGALLAGNARDGSRVLYVGLYTSGLAEIRLDGSWSTDHRSNGLPEEFLLSLLQTDTDLQIPVLWIGTQDSGIARRDAGVWSSFDERNGLPHHAIHGLGELRFLDGVDRQWLGTSGGAVRWEDQRWQSWFAPSAALSVVNAAVRSDESIWLGSDSGLTRMSNKGSRSFTLENSDLPGTVVEALFSEEDANHRGTVWIGTHHGLAKVIDGVVGVVPVPPLGREPSIRAFAQTATPEGKLFWAGGDPGLAYRRGETWFGLAEQCHDSTDNLLDLREQGTPGNSHYLWVANRDGITRIDLDHDFACAQPPESVLLPEVIYNVQFDASQRMYLFGKQGVIRLTPDPQAPDDLSRLKTERFGLDSGLPTLEFNRGSLVDRLGRIWASSVEGAVLYDPREEAPPPNARPFRLLSAQIDGSSAPLRDGVVLHADENNLIFDFSLLSFQRDRLTRYRTELIGSDEPQSGWVAEGHRAYQRLPAGEYTFRAYARDGFGIEAEPLSMRFEIQPPLWRQWWAIVLYAIAAIALSAGVSRWRIERVRRAAKVLEGVVDERTASLKVANAQLEDARNAAEAATQAKSIFLANMSHEIRTPMNAVLGFAGLGMRLDIPAKPREYFRKINNSGQNLLNILNDILDFSKIEAGKLALETVPFALSDVLAQVSDLFAIKASEKNLEFVVGAAPDVPDHYIGDPLRLGQVLLNLINNAIKFTRAGFVQLYVERQIERSDTPRSNDRILLRFAVEDSGIGMSETQIARLFQPFSQADHSTTRTFGGTGLGLTISQRLVAQMGGAITVRSHPGAGSCFQFEIGLKPQASTAPHRVPPDEVQGCRILIVDDSEQARTWLRDQLTALRFNVYCVDSGEAALSALRTEHFDVILMDWMMPGIDGIETTRRIKGDLGLTAIPEVIMVTAHGRETIKDAAESVGIHRFLIKPVDASVLLDTIVDVLGADTMRTKPPSESDHASATLGGVHVLLAEDNPVNQQLAIEMLASAGIGVDVADNGAAAVKRAVERHYDAILMDIEMPEMDGYTAARQLREQSPDGPPIIAMTAHATVDHRWRCIEAGMVDVVTKPVLFDELIDTLRKYLRVPETPKQNGHPESSANSVLDARTAIARMNGNAALFRKLVAMFADLHRNASAEITEALAQNDVRAALRIAHSVGGAAGNLAATRLHAAAMAIENTGEHGSPSEAQIAEFDAALEETVRACESYIATH